MKRRQSTLADLGQATVEAISLAAVLTAGAIEAGRHSGGAQLDQVRVPRGEVEPASGVLTPSHEKCSKQQVAAFAISEEGPDATPNGALVAILDQLD